MTFKQLTHLETAFSLFRNWGLIVVLASMVTCMATVYFGFNEVNKARESIYVLQNEHIIQAALGSRKQILEVEARDHVRNFHHHFFTLAPDEEAIKITVNKAFYLADQSAKEAYDNLREKGYFSQLIAANISQSISEDSIRVIMDGKNIAFEFHGIQKLTRSSSVTERQLITKGRLREVSRSNNNPHGFLIERWETISNRDLKTYAR